SQRSAGDGSWRTGTGTGTGTGRHSSLGDGHWGADHGNTYRSPRRRTTARWCPRGIPVSASARRCARWSGPAGWWSAARLPAACPGWRRSARIRCRHGGRSLVAAGLIPSAGSSTRFHFLKFSLQLLELGQHGRDLRIHRGVRVSDLGTFFLLSSFGAPKGLLHFLGSLVVLRLGACRVALLASRSGSLRREAAGTHYEKRRRDCWNHKPQGERSGGRVHRDRKFHFHPP